MQLQHARALQLEFKWKPLLAVRRPGAYAEGNAWLKHKHKYTAPTAQQRVNFARVASAPSIPYRNQCYGYEEGPTGSLVMQPPPDVIHSGMGR